MPIALSGVLMIAAMVVVNLRLRSSDGWKGFAIFNLVSAPILLAGVVIMIPFTGSAHMGLVERFMVSGCQVFYFVSGLLVFLRN